MVFHSPHASRQNEDWGVVDRNDHAIVLQAAFLVENVETKVQLFADVKDDALVGIVKSQSNRDLVYSCRLDQDGSFACCTQNLRPCGGLRGALCKHLLVLIVGLTRAGQLDPQPDRLRQHLHAADRGGDHRDPVPLLPRR